MKIEHVALWTNNIEEMKDFYCKYFNGRANIKYENKSKKFESYFISFDTGARLEIMHVEGIVDSRNEAKQMRRGLVHMAISTGSQENVDKLTELIRKDGYRVEGEPRKTGDGYYESCILDPDGNIIEITV